MDECLLTAVIVRFYRHAISCVLARRGVQRVSGGVQHE